MGEKQWWGSSDGEAMVGEQWWGSSGWEQWSGAVAAMIEHAIGLTVRSREHGAGRRRQGGGSREQGAGSKEQGGGRGKREQGAEPPHTAATAIELISSELTVWQAVV